MKQLKTIPFNQRHLKRTLNFRKPHSVLYRMWYAHLNLDDRHPTKTTLPKVYTSVCVCVCYGGFRGGQSQKPIATIQPNNKETCRPVGTWSSVLGNRTHTYTWCPQTLPYPYWGSDVVLVRRSAQYNGNSPKNNTRSVWCMWIWLNETHWATRN